MTTILVNSPATCAQTAADTLKRYAGRDATSFSLSDLLTDLAHLSLDRDWDFAAEARLALFNALEERK